MHGLISDQHEFLEKGIKAIGESLNPLVSDMHNSSRNEVKFRTKKKVFKRRRTTITEDVAVSNPSNSQLCPEAFDGRPILKHICHYYRQYADMIDYESSFDFKMKIKEIIGRIPKRPNPSLTWDVAIDTIYRMASFVEVIVEGLHNAANSTLAVSISGGVETLRDIAERANEARELLQCMKKK